MTPPAMSEALAAEHIRDLGRAAARHQLVEQARRSRPSARHRAAAGVRGAVTVTRAWFRRGQLGPTAAYCTAC